MAPGVAAEVDASLDAYARSWAAMHEQACLAHRSGAESDTLLDLRMSCLGRRLGDFDALVSLLRQQGPAAVERARAALDGRSVELRYRVGPRGHGPRALRLNGAPLAFTREPNPYREGGAVVPMTTLRERLRDDANDLIIELG